MPAAGGSLENTKDSEGLPSPRFVACCCCCTGTGRRSSLASPQFCCFHSRLSSFHCFAFRWSQVCLCEGTPHLVHCREPSEVAGVPPSDQLAHCSNSNGTLKLGSC